MSICGIAIVEEWRNWSCRVWGNVYRKWDAYLRLYCRCQESGDFFEIVISRPDLPTSLDISTFYPLLCIVPDISLSIFSLIH
jgi:hypothetical protein